MRLLILSAAVVFSLALTAGVVEAKHHHHHDHHHDRFPGLANVTLLLVRHAEKPANDDDPGLSPAGQKRAEAYATYFNPFQLDGTALKVDTLIAAADSKKSDRPRLTLEPLSKATGINIQTPYADKEVKDAARWIEQGHAKHAALIAWHHGELDKLLEKLGAPDDLVPGGKWPSDVFDWVIVLRYDANGDLSASQRIVEPANLKHATLQRGFSPRSAPTAPASARSRAAARSPA